MGVKKTGKNLLLRLADWQKNPAMDAGELAAIIGSMEANPFEAESALGRLAWIAERSVEQGRLACLRAILAHPTAKKCVQGSRGGDGAARPSLLILAARESKAECIELLLPHANPRESDFRKMTPLHLAAENGFVRGVELLLPGSDPNATDTWGRTPLMAAVKARCKKAVRLLAPHTDLTLESEDGRAPLDEALWEGDEEMVAILIERWASPTEKELRLARSAISQQLWELEAYPERAGCMEQMAAFMTQEQCEDALEALGSGALPRVAAQRAQWEAAALREAVKEGAEASRGERSQRLDSQDERSEEGSEKATTPAKKRSAARL